MTSFSVAGRPVTTLSGGLSCSSWTSRKEPDLVLRAHEEAERHLARLPTSTMLANRAAAPEPSGLALVIVANVVNVSAQRIHRDHLPGNRGLQ